MANRNELAAAFDGARLAAEQASTWKLKARINWGHVKLKRAPAGLKRESVRIQLVALEYVLRHRTDIQRRSPSHT